MVKQHRQEVSLTLAIQIHYFKWPRSTKNAKSKSHSMLLVQAGYILSVADRTLGTPAIFVVITLLSAGDSYDFHSLICRIYLILIVMHVKWCVEQKRKACFAIVIALPRHVGTRKSHKSQLNDSWTLFLPLYNFPRLKISISWYFQILFSSYTSSPNNCHVCGSFLVPSSHFLCP